MTAAEAHGASAAFLRAGANGAAAAPADREQQAWTR